MTRKTWLTVRDAALILLVVLIGGWLIAKTVRPGTHVATSYYVALTGSNSNPGTAAAPWRNIAFGVSRLQPGDTLCVAPGVYSEPADRLDSQAAGGTGYRVPSGTATAYITVSSCGGARWTMQLPAGAGSCIRFATLGVSYVEVADFICEKLNEGSSSNAIYVSAGSSYNRFLRFEARNGRGVGVGANVTNGDSVGNVFADCDVHHFGVTSSVNSGYGFYLDASESVIERCDIHHNVGWGVHIYNFSASAHRNRVVGNRVHDNGTGGGSNGGILYAQGADGEVTNNLVWNNRGGIAVYTGSQRLLVANNTITQNGPANGIEAQYYAAPPVLRNNILWRSGVVCDYGAGSTCTAGTATQDHNLLTDPGFTDAAKSDFSISTSSPAFDAGGTVDAVRTDATGVTRPQGKAFDIGAYEVPAMDAIASTGTRPVRIPALSSEAVAVTTVPAVLEALVCTNPNGERVYVQVFDGTTPAWSLGIAPGQTLPVTALALGFVTAVHVAATTTVSGSTAPAVPVTCNFGVR